MGKLDGKIALVIGASEGIGLAIAQIYVSEGARVYITGRRQDALEKAVAKISAGDKLIAVRSDASSLGDITKLYEQIKRENHRLDILVLNAGIVEYLTLGTITEQHFDAIIGTNFKGVLFNVQAALPIFTDGGSIIIIGSAASIKGVPGISVYSATKAAVRSFARSWSVELKQRKIRVNIISPGTIHTRLYDEQSEEDREFEKKLQLMDRIGEPEEVAKAALFLASTDDSSFITGIELFVDGGSAQI